MVVKCEFYGVKCQLGLRLERFDVELMGSMSWSAHNHFSET